MKTTITCVAALVAVAFANPLILARQEQGSADRQECTKDDDCALPNGKCSLPLSGGTAPKQIMNDIIIKIGHPYCFKNAGCDCVLYTKDELVELCKEYNAKIIGPNAVVVDGCMNPDTKQLQCDGYLKEFDPTHPETGFGPESAGDYCKTHGL